MLKLYNGLTRKKERFEPQKPGHVSLYVCGITVYDRCHMGHARSMIGFDVIVRFLKACDYQVKFVRNITDIDDKIIVRAASLGIPIQTLTAQSIQAMYEDTEALGLLPPDSEPRATDYIEPIIQLIQRLITNGLAYVSDDGDVCFEVAKFKTYGQLSQQDLDGLMAGARVDIVASKRSPLDFVLWKKAKIDEPSWASPWGEGRPGWHIECSAMSMGVLGETLDIHGGGVDLQFPHHENELAQSEGATGKRFANYWMHVGLLQINREKMAKSTGNFLTIESVLKQYPGEVLRYFLLSSHYRSVLNYSDDALQQASKSLARLYQALKGVDGIDDCAIQQDWVSPFFDVMNDDFNTPEALSVLFELSHELNKTQEPSLAATLKYLGGILGLLQQDPTVFLQSGQSTIDHACIDQKIAEREAARQAKDFKRADEVRDWLLEQGIVLEDSSMGTTWRDRG